jgi:hypothetical protein
MNFQIITGSEEDHTGTDFREEKSISSIQFIGLSSQVSRRGGMK